MPKPLSLFPTYKKNEDRISNYCGLLMRMVYEERPAAFEELLSNILDLHKSDSFYVGPRFIQQELIGGSVVDLAIRQSSFRLAIETKLYDWFHSDQLERHLEGFKSTTENTALLLLSNFETDDYRDLTRFPKVVQLAEKNNIQLSVLSFEDFITLLEALDLSPTLTSTLEEFKGFLDTMGLLPAWKYLLDVVNCATMSHEVEAGAYMCPDTGGAYSHRRAKWFGMYGQKRVSRIYHIDAVVSLTAEDGYVKWKNIEESEDMLLGRARTHISHEQWRVDRLAEEATQVFLLSDGVDTNFIKSSSGGMIGSKKYFWGAALPGDTTAILAERLDGQTWT